MSECPSGSGLYQLWTLVLHTVHQIILGLVSSIRTLLLSPVSKKTHNRSRTGDTQSEQLCTRAPPGFTGYRTKADTGCAVSSRHKG
ncbi:hypothetical protein CHARACLAT_022956 [Characodon lateralis]|uniref:Uncharacterized protein n=1 Tax=Characodon lateralis TaxID=208331 RepID=A0ABU7ELI7_9TELE|nr:hypothetical protein [Characodon lateralis]